ncbi:hypothetical protein GCM10008090_14560 [Arenicella chitinivorans]|uniref:Glycosyltransferase n=1 Tax=Arenicella chitinivorans TaxID=1329800 RepID=A0A918RPG8_9GAMM|nr:glycosyltransferase family 4 protein [Arenicella chitinivorans]GHA06009.1 hypothetical protein GCM10008090_14560 [Arenicella chitinivorans]
MRVLIYQRIVPHYRVRFFEALHTRLKKVGIEMQLVYGNHRDGYVPEGVDIDQEWAVKVNNRYLSIFGQEIVFQGGFSALRGKPCLVIVEQASRLTLNYLIHLSKRTYGFKLAYWGHGQNFQCPEVGIKSVLKNLLLKQVDHFFAYTTSSMNILTERGFDRRNVTVVDNSIDTTKLQFELSQCSDAQIEKIRRDLEIDSDTIGLFCGGLDERKEFDFLFQACDRIKNELSAFNIIFIGHGPKMMELKEFAASRPWVHVVGPITGQEKAAYFTLARCLVMPGALGLVVIDSFVSSTPMVTTEIETHSPEFDYLISGENSLITKVDIDEFSKQVVMLFKDQGLHARLQEGGRASATQFTLANMVERFAIGIENTLTE